MLCLETQCDLVSSNLPSILTSKFELICWDISCNIACSTELETIDDITILKDNDQDVKSNYIINLRDNKFERDPKPIVCYYDILR